MSSGAHCGHVECGSDVCPAAPYGTSSPMSATVSVQGSDAHKGGDLLTVEGTEFGKGASTRVKEDTEPIPGTSMRRLSLPFQRELELMRSSISLSRSSSSWERKWMCLWRLGRRGSRARLRRRDSAAFHVDELPSASEEGLEMGCLRVWERAGVGPEGKGEAGDGVGIDWHRSWPVYRWSERSP